tara:strand:+ start:1545 stop:1820 length:276 start_codon:yes stop_codon:yes gene_type:complete
MKKILLILPLSLIFGVTLAQVKPFKSEKVFSESDPKAKFHTVSGERHGPAFFKKHEFPEVEYGPTDQLTFDKYHTVDVMYHWYELWAEKYP